MLTINTYHHHYHEPDPWSPLRQNVGEDLKDTYLKEVQQFLDRRKSQHYAENAALNGYYL